MSVLCLSLWPTTPAPLPLAQALPCLSTGTRLTAVFLTFSVLAHGGRGGT